MHDNGINVRYLGRLHRLVLEMLDKDDGNTASTIRYVLPILRMSMLARAAKHLLNHAWRHATLAQLAHVTCQFLCHLFGTPTHGRRSGGGGGGSAKRRSAQNGHPVHGQDHVSDSAERPADSTMHAPVSAGGAAGTAGTAGTDAKQTGGAPLSSPNALWTALLARVRVHFGIRLLNAGPERSPTVGAAALHALGVAPLAMLRALCRMAGVQIRARNYDFAAAQPFASDDIVELIPVAKYTVPQVRAHPRRTLFARPAPRVSGPPPSSSPCARAARRTGGDATGDQRTGGVLVVFRVDRPRCDASIAGGHGCGRRADRDCTAHRYAGGSTCCASCDACATVSAAWAAL